MPYNFAADSFHTKKLCSRLSSSEVKVIFMEIGRFAFLSPLSRGFITTYDDHLRLIGKRIVDFLLVLIELFSLSVPAEAQRANIGSKSAISLQRSFGCIKIWTYLSSVLSQSTRLSDRQTDGRTAFSSLDSVCIPCSAVIKLNMNLNHDILLSANPGTRR